MLEIGLKNAQMTVADLEQRVRVVLSENEKLKIAATEKIQLAAKVNTLLKEQARFNILTIVDCIKKLQTANSR